MTDFIYQAPAVNQEVYNDSSFFALGDLLGCTEGHEDCIRRLFSWIRRLKNKKISNLKIKNPQKIDWADCDIKHNKDFNLILSDIKNSKESEELDKNTILASIKMAENEFKNCLLQEYNFNLEKISLPISEEDIKGLSNKISLDYNENNTEAKIRTAQNNPNIANLLVTEITYKRLLVIKNDILIGFIHFRLIEYKCGRKITSVYEAVLNPNMTEDENHYIHVHKNHKVVFNNVAYEVYGYKFCQKDSITYMCAEASLKMLFDNLPNQKLPLQYYEINDSLGLDRSRISYGLKTGQISEFLSKKGLNFNIYSNGVDDTLNPIRKLHKCNEYVLSPKKTTGYMDIIQTIYSSLESNHPSLICFFPEEGKEGHIIPVFGHTFNEDLWTHHSLRHYFFRNELKYLSSLYWIDNFIVHDDNLGTNFCFPQNYFQDVRTMAWGIMPDKLDKFNDFNTLEFETSSIAFLQSDEIKKLIIDNSGYWGEKLINSIIKGTTVTRKQVISFSHYTNHLEKTADNFPEELKAVFKKEDVNIVLIEISVNELFQTNQKKLCDIIFIDDTKNSKNLYAPKFLRIPNFFAIIADKIYGTQIGPQKYFDLCTLDNINN